MTAYAAAVSSTHGIALLIGLTRRARVASAHTLTQLAHVRSGALTTILTIHINPARSYTSPAGKQSNFIITDRSWLLNAWHPRCRVLTVANSVTNFTTDAKEAIVTGLTPRTRRIHTGLLNASIFSAETAIVAFVVESTRSANGIVIIDSAPIGCWGDSH